MDIYSTPSLGDFVRLFANTDQTPCGYIVYDHFVGEWLRRQAF